MQIAKWGDSLAVQLPQNVVEALKLKEGDEVEIVVAGDRRLELEVKRKMTREEALAELDRLKRPLPPSFKFNRDEANER